MKKLHLTLSLLLLLGIVGEHVLAQKSAAPTPAPAPTAPPAPAASAAPPAPAASAAPPAPPSDPSATGTEAATAPIPAATKGEAPTDNSSVAAEIQSFLEPFIYDPKGRRDPFKPYVELKGPEEMVGRVGPFLPLQRFDLDQIKLIGVIWDVNSPKAMLLDPNNQVHIVGRDERIGSRNGYIAAIREGEVVVVESQKTRGEVFYSTRVLRIAR